MHSNHGTPDSHDTNFISEKSIQDKVLSLTSVLVLVSLFLLGCYWQFLPLPIVQVEEELLNK